jgi:hypothetical protein
VSAFEGDKESCDHICLNKNVFSIGPTDLVDHVSNSTTKRDTASETEANLNRWSPDFATTANGRYPCQELIHSYVLFPIPKTTKAKLFEYIF